MLIITIAVVVTLAIATLGLGFLAVLTLLWLPFRSETAELAWSDVAKIWLLFCAFSLAAEPYYRLLVIPMMNSYR